jgi:hypothetical protein
MRGHRSPSDVTVRGPLERRPIGTNGYVSTWGAVMSVCHRRAADPTAISRVDSGVGGWCAGWGVSCGVGCWLGMGSGGGRRF